MQREAPFVISVVGLKKSGKTTVAAGLIAGLSARGLAVAALKRSHLPDLTFDSRGTDSSRLLEAGARFVAVRSHNQTLTVERHEGTHPSADLLGLVPSSVDLVVGEGLFPSPQAAAHVPAPETSPLHAIVCLRRFEELEETLRVRGVRPAEVLALSGLAAGGEAAEAPAAGAAAAAAATPAKHGEYLVFDVLDPRSAEALCDLVLATAGLASPAPPLPSGG